MCEATGRQSGAAIPSGRRALNNFIFQDCAVHQSILNIQLFPGNGTASKAGTGRGTHAAPHPHLRQYLHQLLDRLRWKYIFLSRQVDVGERQLVEPVQFHDDVLSRALNHQVDEFNLVGVAAVPLTNSLSAFVTARFDDFLTRPR